MQNDSLADKIKTLIHTIEIHQKHDYIDILGASEGIAASSEIIIFCEEGKNNYTEYEKDRLLSSIAPQANMIKERAERMSDALTLAKELLQEASREST